MKTLILLRHAKSDWSEWNNFNGIGSDFERPLSERGQNACSKISQAFVSMQLKVDLVEYSPAKRASETFNFIKNSLKFSFQRPNLNLYTFNSADLFNVISKTSNEVSKYLLVGHNPAIENLISDLIPSDHESEDLLALRNKYPTGALAFLELNIFNWDDLTQNCANLKKFLRPIDINVKN